MNNCNFKLHISFEAMRDNYIFDLATIITVEVCPSW